MTYVVIWAETQLDWFPVSFFRELGADDQDTIKTSVKCGLCADLLLSSLAYTGQRYGNKNATQNVELLCTAS